jgi:predicted esterase
MEMNVKYRLSRKILIPILLLLATGCTKETPEEQPVQNDYFVRTEAFNAISKEMLKFVFDNQGYGQYAPLMQSDVRPFRVVYTTEYPKGTKINVSGALLLPDNYNPRFPVVVLNHGTYGDRNSAPSKEIQKNLPSSIDVFLGMAIASAFNCALLMPDYIGYGESQSVTHPYMHGESLGQTGLDFIRAFREYTADPAVALSFNSNIFITGYSEGGYAAVALHKAIDARPAEGLKVYKNVAGAGAYDMEAFSKAVASNSQPLGLRMLSSYLWVLEMYKNDFRYSKSYADIFSETDNALLQSINYDIAYFGNEAAELPLHDVAAELFQPEFISGIMNETDTEFIRISRENSLIDFVPKDSLIFVWGDADNWVYPVNSENAYNAMRSKGCKVASCIQPGGDHNTTMPLYIEVVLDRLQAIAGYVEETHRIAHLHY